MGTVTKHLQPTITFQERRQRILETAQSLAARRSNLTLDEIDGNFWWRCCRLDFVAEIAAIERQLSGPLNGDEFEGAIAGLDSIARAYGIPRTAIAAHISHDAPIAIKEPALSFHY